MTIVAIKYKWFASMADRRQTMTGATRALLGAGIESVADGVIRRQRQTIQRDQQNHARMWMRRLGVDRAYRAGRFLALGAGGTALLHLPDEVTVPVRIDAECPHGGDGLEDAPHPAVTCRDRTFSADPYTHPTEQELHCLWYAFTTATVGGVPLGRPVVQARTEQGKAMLLRVMTDDVGGSFKFDERLVAALESQLEADSWRVGYHPGFTQNGRVRRRPSPVPRYDLYGGVALKRGAPVAVLMGVRE